MTRIKGPFALGLAVVLCPCHLPIVAAVLGGTVLGAAITEHLALVVPLTAVGFVAALILGVRWITREEAPTCEPCESPTRATATKATATPEAGAARAADRVDGREPVASRR